MPTEDDLKKRSEMLKIREGWKPISETEDAMLYHFDHLRNITLGDDESDRYLYVAARSTFLKIAGRFHDDPLVMGSFMQKIIKNYSLDNHDDILEFTRKVHEIWEIETRVLNNLGRKDNVDDPRTPR